jgi:hypothetical protein
LDPFLARLLVAEVEEQPGITPGTPGWQLFFERITREQCVSSGSKFCFMKKNNKFLKRNFSKKSNFFLRIFKYFLANF